MYKPVQHLCLNVINRPAAVNLRRAAIVCLSFAFATSAFALPRGYTQPHEDLKLSVMRFVKQQFGKDYRVQTQVGKIDPHLRLAACTTKVEAFFPLGARKMGPSNIGLRCQGKKTWTIYLPVNIRVYGKAVVSKRPLPRGTILHANDLSLVSQELSRAMQGYFTRIDELDGMTLRRSLARGAILQPQNVKQRHLVKRGDMITILGESKGISIRVKGKAMMDGYRGQSIRVKNFRSKRELQGEVISAGTVRINL